MGWGAVADQAGDLINTDFRQAMAEGIEARQPNMSELLFNMVDTCPQAASQAGVTVMLGMQYEISAGIKWINSYYLALGTANINFNVVNNSAGIEFQYNLSGGVWTDICAGAGPDIGVDLTLMGGIFLSGEDRDLGECSFLFDVDAGVGSAFGLAVGVGGTRCVPKFFITNGFGLGAGIGFNGCGTVSVSRLNF